MSPPARPQLEPRPSLTVIGSAAAPTLPLTGVKAAVRYPELAGQRGIAVLAVVVFHVYQFCNVNHFLYRGTPAYTVLNSLDAMVPWLFVLIAFLLFEPIARSFIDGAPRITAREFMSRRAIRILPLYYVAVLLVWFSRQPALPGDWRDLLEHLTFTQIFDSKRIFYTNGPAWAVSVDVIFCLGLALLIVVLGRICGRITTRRRRIAVLAGTALLMGLISIAWKARSFSVDHHVTTGALTTWFGPLASLDNFAVGMAVAVIVAALGDVRASRPRTRLALRVTGLTILCVAFAIRNVDTWNGAYFPTTCAVGFGPLVAAAVLGPRDRWGQVLSCRPLLWLGAISYSVYLWHEPILLALHGSHGLVRQAPDAFIGAVVIVTAVSILVGWLSYLVIERPTRQLGRAFGRDRQLIPTSSTSADRADWERRHASQRR